MSRARGGRLCKEGWDARGGGSEPCRYCLVPCQSKGVGGVGHDTSDDDTWPGVRHACVMQWCVWQE